VNNKTTEKNVPIYMEIVIKIIIISNYANRRIKLPISGDE